MIDARTRRERMHRHTELLQPRRGRVVERHDFDMMAHFQVDGRQLSNSLDRSPAGGTGRGENMEDTQTQGLRRAASHWGQTQYASFSRIAL